MSFREDFAVYQQFAQHLGELKDTSRQVLRAQSYDPELKKQLDSAINALDSIYSRINASIVEARKDAEKRGMKLLMSLCTQYDLGIGRAISYEDNRFRFAMGQYESKAEELRKLGYDSNSEKAQQILKDTPMPDIDLHRRKIAVITEEWAKIKLFMTDYPRYDMDLLKSTRFESWMLETNNFVDPGKVVYQDNGQKNVTEVREIELDSYGLIAKALGQAQQSETVEAA